MWRSIFYGLIGLGVSLFGCGHTGGPWLAKQADPSAKWLLLDRGQGQLRWLDGDLQTRSIWDVPSPLAAVQSDLGLWLLYAPDHATSNRRLSLIEGACTAWDVPLPGALDLVNSQHPDRVWALRRPATGKEYLEEIGASGHGRRLLEFPGADRLLRVPAGLWVLADSGTVWFWALEEPGQPIRFWGLSAALKLARVYRDSLKVCLASKGSPWQTVHPEKGPGRFAQSPWMPSPQRELRGFSATPAQRAWGSANAVIPRRHGGWILVHPESIWCFTPDGQGHLGQGGFGYVSEVLEWHQDGGKGK